MNSITAFETPESRTADKCSRSLGGLRRKVWVAATVQGFEQGFRSGEARHYRVAAGGFDDPSSRFFLFIHGFQTYHLAVRVVTMVSQ